MPRIYMADIEIVVSDILNRLLGFTNNVKRIMEVHRCVVLPSYREGIPVTLLEA